MLPSHLPGRGPALGGGVVLIIMCAKAREKALNLFGKCIFMFTALVGAFSIAFRELLFSFT